MRQRHSEPEAGHRSNHWIGFAEDLLDRTHLQRREEEEEGRCDLSTLLLVSRSSPGTASIARESRVRVGIRNQNP